MLSPTKIAIRESLFLDAAKPQSQLTMAVQFGGHVRFRAGKAPEALKGRERDVCVVVAHDPRGDPQPWPVVQFDGYRSVALQPGMVEVVGQSASDDQDFRVNR